MKDMIFVSLSQIEMPKITEVRKGDYVNWGEDNRFPDTLIEYQRRSSLHNAIVRSKVNDICGDGFTYEGKTDKKTDAFIQMANKYESLDEIKKKVAYDLVLFGGYSLNIIWSRDGKYISEIYHIPFNYIRTGLMNERKQIDNYYYCENWKAYRNEYKVIPAFNKELALQQPSQLLYYKSYTPGSIYYPVPSYFGAAASIETDIEIANFHLSHIKNGMMPSMMINFPNGFPTKDEMKTIERQIKDKYVGTDNAGKFIITFSDGKDLAPTVETLSPAQLDKQFIQLQEQVLQNILSGHGVVSPLLVGIPTSVGLGGTEIIQDSWQLYHNRVINPYKDEILSTINKIMNINGMKQLTINTSSPVSFNFSEAILLQILTQDEMREMIGYDPIVQQEAPIQPIAAPIQPETEMKK